MPQRCPHCGKPMIQGVITENYETFHICDCQDAKDIKTADTRELRDNPDKKAVDPDIEPLVEMAYDTELYKVELGFPGAQIKSKKSPKRNPEKNALKEAERYLLDKTGEIYDRYIALALVEEKYGTEIALKLAKKYRIETALDTRDPVIVNPRRPKQIRKNPLAGTDVWGHKLFIENPTPDELQEIADTLGVPVGIHKDLSKETEMYKRFHRRKPNEIVKVEHPGTPKSLVALGKLESVIYRKCSDNQAYIHDLKHGILCSDKTGKLWIIGDRAKITKRGIVG